MKLEQIKAMEAEIIRLRQQNEKLKAAQGVSMNPLYKELIQHLTAGPHTISELAEKMTRDNRTISQWLYQIKLRFGAEVITLSKGEKQLMNPEIFDETVEASEDE